MILRRRFLAAGLLVAGRVALIAADVPGRATSPARKVAPAPDDVERRAVTIWSDGTRMSGDLYRPRDRPSEEKLPAIVLCAGTGGTKGGTQARVAIVFARQGYAVLAFDYRGWGESESQLMAVGPQPRPGSNHEMTMKVRALRWQMNYADQTRDIRAAISFIAGEPGVDSARIGLWGSSYGGGLVTWVAGHDPRVKCTVAQVPGGFGKVTAAREAQAYDLAMRQARGETEPVPIETGRLGGKMAAYEEMRANPAKNIGFGVPEAAARITTPVLFVVAEREELSSNTGVEEVHRSLLTRGIPCRYHVVKGISHYGIYREGFAEATRVELEWFAAHLGKPAR